MVFCLNPAKPVPFPHNLTSLDFPGPVRITSHQLSTQAISAQNAFECSVASARGSRPPSKDSPSAAEPPGKCSILLEWQVACIAMEQGWDKDWVWGQLGKVHKTWVLGEGSAGQSAGKVGPLQGGQREGASLVADHEKQRASPLVSHLLFYPGHALGMGVKFSGACAFDHGGPSLQAGGGSNGSIDGTEGGAPTGEGGLRHGMSGEGGIGVGMEHLSMSGNGVSIKGTGLAGASDAVGGAAHGGGGGAGNGAGGWFAVGGVGGSKMEGGLAGQ
ncbi:hypothetical protein E4T56_gene1722 [Termitomyces sp. T112]|nr:hypothetical protein E4T56_gene1722 [Termitomyces sp. T112]